MDAEHLASLRQAAAALISTAAAPTVLAALQTLLADPAFTTIERPPSLLPVGAIAPAPVRTPSSAPPSTPRAATPPRRSASAAPAVVDTAWEELRGQAKAAMAERGASYADVAAAISRSEIATRIAIGSRKPPRPVVRTRLQEWLANGTAAAPEVAPRNGMTFPGNGAGRAYVDTSTSFSAAD